MNPDNLIHDRAPSPLPPGGLRLSVKGDDAGLVIIWAGRGLWRGDTPVFFLGGIILLGLCAFAFIRSRVRHAQPEFSIVPVAGIGAAALTLAWCFAQTSISFEVSSGALTIRRKVLCFSRTTTFAPGQIRDVRFEDNPLPQSRHDPKRVLRIQDIHYERHDYLIDYPAEGLEWIAQTLRHSGVCHGATLPHGLNQDW